MPYWLGYSIYSSQNSSTIVSSVIATEDKGPPSYLKYSEVVTHQDYAQLIGYSIYSSQNSGTVVSFSQVAKEKGPAF